VNRIRPGSLMIRVLAVFFGVVTAYATYVNAGRQPISGAPAPVEQALLDEALPSSPDQPPVASTPAAGDPASRAAQSAGADR